MVKKHVTKVGEPFWAESKKSWMFYYIFLDENLKKRRRPIKRKQKKALLDERAKYIDQMELTGNSAPYDFPTIASFRNAENLASKADLDVAIVIKEVIKNLSNTIKEITVKDAWFEFRDGDFKKYYEPSTQGTNRSSLNKFAEKFGQRNLGSISEEDIFDHANQLRESVKRNSTKREISAIKSFFDWAKSRKQKYIQRNPCDDWSIEEFWPMTNEEKAEDKQPKIHSPGEIERILQATLEIDPLFLPAVVLKSYGFLRTCEVRKICPCEVDIKNRKIFVGAKVAKKGKNGTPRPRVIEELCDAFVAFLVPFSDSAGKLATLDVRNFHRRMKAIYQHAFERENIERDNELRHGCASYTYADTNDIGLVRKNMGHRSKSESVTWEHYINELLFKEQARAFFAIRPPADYAERIAEFQAQKAKSNPGYPSDKELQKLVLTTPIVHIAESIGYTEAAVRKHLKKKGIKTPPKGYWQRLRALQAKTEK